jgi:hypothetical protein
MSSRTRTCTNMLDSPFSPMSQWSPPVLAQFTRFGFRRSLHFSVSKDHLKSPSIFVYPSRISSHCYSDLREFLRTTTSVTLVMNLVTTMTFATIVLRYHCCIFHYFSSSADVIALVTHKRCLRYSSLLQKVHIIPCSEFCLSLRGNRSRITYKKCLFT